MTRIEQILRGAASVALAVGITLTTFGAPVVSADHQGANDEIVPPAGCAFGNDHEANDQTATAPGCEIAEAARENAHGHEDQDPGQDDDEHDKDHGRQEVNRGNGGHGNGNGHAGASGHGRGGRGR